MGTPSKATEKILFPKKPRLSVDTWIKVIESWGNITGVLPDTELTAIGSTRCLAGTGDLSYEHDKHSFDIDKPRIRADKGLSRETRGLFKVGTTARYNEGRKVCQLPNDDLPQGSFPLWGLSKRGVWILARVTWVGHTYHQATRVRIHRVTNLRTLMTFAGVSPRDIWELLGSAVKEHQARCQRAAKHARFLNRQFSGDSKLLQLRGAKLHT